MLRGSLPRPDGRMWRAASPALRRSAAALAVSSGAGVAFGAVASRRASAAAAAPTPPPIKLACIQLSLTVVG